MPETALTATSRLTAANRLDHFLARCSFRRSAHRVTPGVYALGAPGPASPVFVTANYTLSFDALRSALAGRDAYILVLDTKGINVWCAAGKGTFGTEELIARIESVRLGDLVSHRRLILPQLGAPGVAAHVVRQSTGFTVEYGPVRAADLPAYLERHEATPGMREVRFTLRDRLVLIPVELVAALLPLLVVSLLRLWPAAAAILAGVVLFPLLLPWLPTHDFSSKGFILGCLIAAVFGVPAIGQHPAAAWWRQGLWMLAYLTAFPPITAFLALNFTGSTTFTSRCGVRREIYRYVPAMALLFFPGALLYALLVFHVIG